MTPDNEQENEEIIDDDIEEEDTDLDDADDEDEDEDTQPQGNNMPTNLSPEEADALRAQLAEYDQANAAAQQEAANEPYVAIATLVKSDEFQLILDELNTITPQMTAHAIENDFVRQVQQTVQGTAMSMKNLRSMLERQVPSLMIPPPQNVPQIPTP